MIVLFYQFILTNTYFLEMILVDRICNNLAKNAQQSANITHIEKNVWEDSKTITLDETYEKWDYRIKNIEKMNEKIKINMKVLNLIRSGEYKELFSNKPFKCTECKIGFKSVNELRDHVDEYGDYKLTNGNWENNAYFKNEELTTFKLSRNECEMCHSNIVVIIKLVEFHYF